MLNSATALGIVVPFTQPLKEIANDKDPVTRCFCTSSVRIDVRAPWSYHMKSIDCGLRKQDACTVWHTPTFGQPHPRHLVTTHPTLAAGLLSSKDQTPGSIYIALPSTSIPRCWHSG